LRKEHFDRQGSQKYGSSQSTQRLNHRLTHRLNLLGKLRNKIATTRREKLPMPSTMSHFENPILRGAMLAAELLFQRVSKIFVLPKDHETNSAFQLQLDEALHELCPLLARFTVGPEHFRVTALLADRSFTNDFSVREPEWVICGASLSGKMLPGPEVSGLAVYSPQQITGTITVRYDHPTEKHIISHAPADVKSPVLKRPQFRAGEVNTADRDEMLTYFDTYNFPYTSAGEMVMAYLGALRVANRGLAKSIDTEYSW